MTLITQLVDIGRCQIFLGSASVSIVAGRTRHFSFEDRHVRCAFELGFDVVVALRAGVKFCGFNQLVLFALGGMSTVAT